MERHELLYRDKVKQSLREKEMTTMPYTYKDALEEVGSSTSWEDARVSSIKKWEQIASGDTESYERGDLCGFCIVKHNRGENCSQCPALPACDESLSAEEVLRILLGLAFPEEDNSDAEL